MGEWIIQLMKFSGEGMKEQLITFTITIHYMEQVRRELVLGQQLTTQYTPVSIVLR
jgi:hypothetical protein